MSHSKSYYDILGIRPTARPAEIELAFRGRRTQYHPDKYGTADAETIRWATEMMQAVNEAYETLSSTDARVRYDQRRQSGQREASPSPSANPTGNTQGREEGIQACPCILDYLATIPLNQQDVARFHFAPNIPEAKLAKALASRRHFATRPPSRVYLLIDDTLFGGGADGLLITDSVISFKTMFLDSEDYVFTMGWRGGFYVEDTTVKRFDEVCKSFTQISPPAIQQLVWGLNQFFVDRFAWQVHMALRGDVDAQFKLSLSCDYRSEEAFKWLTMAAENGHINAQHNLGKYYEDKDPQRAFAWLTRAAQQGSANAQRALGADIFKQFY